MQFWDFFTAHKHEVLTQTMEHVWLVGVSMLLAVAIGVPLGILLSRRPGWKGIVGVFKDCPEFEEAVRLGRE